MTRMTSQRLKVLSFLRATKTHPSAEEVYQEVVKELPSITLATVYRNLNVLAEQGIITRIKVGHSYRYDAQEGDHAHGICRVCGKVYDVELPEQEWSVKIRGFVPEERKVLFMGHCKKCENR